MMKTKENYNQFSQKLESTLKENLFDQDEVVETIIKTLIQSYMLKTKSKVQALFTFIGAPNSGKHYTCELLEKLNPKVKQIKTFYMDQFSGGIGIQQQLLTSFKKDIINFVQNNPNAILVFEDIEKADLQIQLALYTLFTDYEKNDEILKEDGKIDFSNIIVIVTTTILSSLLQRKDLQRLLKNDPLQAHTFLMERLAKEQISVGDTIDIAFDILIAFLYS